MKEFTVKFTKMELDGEESYTARVQAHNSIEAYGKARQKLAAIGFKTINHNMCDVIIKQLS